MVRDKKKSTKKSKKPIVFNYHDYRIYLQDVLSHLKTKKISARNLAKEIGISHGYLSLVIKNQRNLSEKVLKKLAPFLELNEQETKYLVNLMILSDSGKPEEKNTAFKKIKNLSKYKENFSQELGTYKYLENWLYVAIRELANSDEFKADAAWIKEKLPTSVRSAEINKSLDFLFDNGFLSKNKKGKVKVTEKDIRCIGGVFQLSLGNFHRTMLEKAQEALTLYDKHQRKQIGYTMAIAQSDFDAVKNIIEEAKEKIRALENKSKKNPDTVYHVNFSAFPLAGEGSK